MDFIDQYFKLVEANQWDKALPLIERIVNLNPTIATSWFNYGVCLEALEEYNDSVFAFSTAYRLNQEDYSAQYRVFRNLTLANNKSGFEEFLSVEIYKTPEIAELLKENLFFSEMLSELDINKYL